MPRNRNKARDRRRADNPKRRRNRTIAPNVYKPENKVYRTEEQQKQVRMTMEILEMNGIRSVEQVKLCGSCGNSMDTVKNFDKDNRSPDGWAWQCKACRKGKRKGGDGV